MQHKLRHVNHKQGNILRTAYTTIALAITAATFLGGCATGPQYSDSSYPAGQSSNAPAASYATYYGVVDSIQRTAAPTQTGNIGVGAIAGGVVGGLLGNQVGGGDGKKVATVAGAVGGAYVGHQIQQRNQAPGPDSYQIGVRLDNGTYQSFAQESLNDLQIGSRARINNGQVYRY